MNVRTLQQSAPPLNNNGVPASGAPIVLTPMLYILLDRGIKRDCADAAFTFN